MLHATPATLRRGIRGHRRAPGPLAWVRVVWLTVSVAMLAVGIGAPALAQARSANVVEMDGIISPIAERYLTRAIEDAERSGAEVIIVTLDTPGGLLDSTRGIVTQILASPVPVIVYVSPNGGRAASAGTFITAAAHIAAMAPATNIGAASPVSGQGEDLPETLKSKVFQDTAAEIRAIAQVRGRPVEPLEATVLEAKSYTASEALELGIIDLIADNITALLEQVDGRTVVIATAEGEGAVTLVTKGIEVREVRMGLFDRILSYIADPNVSFLLISLGGLGLFVEFWNPGLIFPGVAGLIALVVGLMALGSLPGNWAGVALILLAFVLVSVEFNTDGFGVFGALGLASFILGGILLFAHFGTPSPVAPDISVSRWVLLPTSGLLALSVGGFVIVMQQARRSARLSGMPAPAVVGMTGIVSSALTPEGKIRVRGETWNARASDGSRIPRGASVIIREEHGPLLEVERIDIPTGTETETENHG